MIAVSPGFKFTPSPFPAHSMWVQLAVGWGGGVHMCVCTCTCVWWGEQELGVVKDASLFLPPQIVQLPLAQAAQAGSLGAGLTLL